MRFIVALALAMVFSAPVMQAEASVHMTGDMAFSPNVDCQTSDCCRLVEQSGQSGNRDDSDPNHCGSEYSCSSFSSLFGENISKEKLPFDSVTRFVLGYSRLSTSSHLINLERPPKLLF